MAAIIVAELPATGRVSTRRFQTLDAGKRVQPDAAGGGGGGAGGGGVGVGAGGGGGGGGGVGGGGVATAGGGVTCATSGVAVADGRALAERLGDGLGEGLGFLVALSSGAFRPAVVGLAPGATSPPTIVAGRVDAGAAEGAAPGIMIPSEAPSTTTSVPASAARMMKGFVNVWLRAWPFGRPAEPAVRIEP